MVKAESGERAVNHSSLISNGLEPVSAWKPSLVQVLGNASSGLEPENCLGQLTNETCLLLRRRRLSLKRRAASESESESQSSDKWEFSDEQRRVGDCS